jgi:hypothetical protein
MVDTATDGEDKDNVVDAKGFQLWRLKFGRTKTSGSATAATAVPEPASCAVAILVLTFLALQFLAG